MVEPRASAPQGVADLDVAAQFVLWAVRTRLEGAAARARLERGFELAQGCGHGRLGACGVRSLVPCGRPAWCTRGPSAPCSVTAELSAPCPAGWVCA
jgi:hypothetical protein